MYFLKCFMNLIKNSPYVTGIYTLRNKGANRVPVGSLRVPCVVFRVLRST